MVTKFCSACALIVMAACTPFAIGAESAWLGSDRTKWANSESRKVENDFAGVLVVTPDKDWQNKWKTSPDTIPYFTESNTVRIGEGLAILTLFANPKTDGSGNAMVLCGIKITRPNGTIAVDERQIPCMVGKLIGPANNLRLSPGVVEFVGEKGDPPGKWLVEVEIHDVNRATTLKLKTTFRLMAN